MAGYNDTRNLIIEALMGRQAGTEIQPEKHQAYALNMLDYVRSVELVSSSTLVGLAEESTVPVQPDQGKVCYIAGVGQDRTVTFSNFIDDEGNPISITTGEMEGVFVILLWNMEHWVAYTFNTNIISSAESANFYYGYNIRKTYASVAAMNADSVNPIGTDGRLIKIGELVTVVNSTTPAENGYYSYEGSENGWLLQSGFSFEVVQTTGTDINKVMSQKAVTDELDQLAGDLSEVQTDVAFKSGKYITISDLTLMGYVNKTNGILGSGADFNRSGKIKVSPLKKYIIRTAATPIMQAGTALFNASGSYLRSINIEPNKDNVVKFDADVDYIIVSGRVGNEQYVKEILDNIPSSEGRILESVELSPVYNITGYIDKTTGLPTSLSAKSTDFIDVSEYDVMHVTPSQTKDMAASFMFYDLNKEMIGRIEVTDLSEIVFNLKNRGIYYFRACDFQGKPSIKVGKYIIEASFKKSLVLRKLNSEMYDGAARKTDGDIIQVPDFFVSEFVPINSIDSYIIENNAIASWVGGHVIYNENKEFVRALSIPLGDVPIRFNEDDKYIKLTLRKDAMSYIYINNYQYKAPNIEEIIEPLQKLQIVSQDTVPIDLWSQGYVNAAGTLISSNYHQYSNLIDISSLKYIVINTDQALDGLASNIWLDINEVPLGKIQARKNIPTIVKVPSEAKYIRLSRAKDNNDVYLNSAVVEPKNLNELIDDSASGDSDWLETIVEPLIKWEYGYYIDAQGKFISINGMAYSKIPLGDNTHIILYSGSNPSDGRKNIFINSSGSVVGAANGNMGEETILPIPSGASHILLSWKIGLFKPRLFLGKTPITVDRTVKFSELTKLESARFQESMNDFAYGYYDPKFDEYNSDKSGVINPTAIMTQNLFLQNTGMIPKEGVCLALVGGSLMLIANGEKYLINLTKI